VVRRNFPTAGWQSGKLAPQGILSLLVLEIAACWQTANPEHWPESLLNQ
jgi:hypothetical protein